jgi:uncharacterized secreted repeat protein (TIGR03808 family)
MTLSRRSVFGVTALAGAALAAQPASAAVAGGMLSAGSLGVVANAARDQSAELQRAIDTATARGGYLLLEPGLYIASGLRIPSALNLVGVPGQSRVVQGGVDPVLLLEGASGIRLDGLVIDGQLRSLPSASSALIEARSVRDIAITNCIVANSHGNGINLTGCSGAISNSTVEACVNAGISALDSRGLRIDGNLVTGLGDNGILIWQSAKRQDASIVTGNRIEKISSRSGGEGQNGNGINVYRAGNVMVTNNQISDCAFTAVRNNSGSDVQILGNNCTRLGEVAIYSEFSVEGSVIANNMIDTSATGISITNFNEGGRLAVCQGNLVRNMSLRNHPVDKRGVGIAAEADTVVAGNVIENAPTAGIWLGWGKYFRNVSATGNVIRTCAIGISASVAAGAQNGLIANNLISGARRGAILGMKHDTPATKDLTLAGARTPATLNVSGNVVS